MALTVLSHVEIYDDAAVIVTDTAECRSFLARIAQSALDAAAVAAPIYSGHYASSLYAKASDDPQGKPRAVVGSSSSFWHFVEYGALNTPPYHTLGNAVQSVVQKYEDLPPGGGGD